jgi:hypothetical protein
MVLHLLLQELQLHTQVVVVDQVILLLRHQVVLVVAELALLQLQAQQVHLDQPILAVVAVAVLVQLVEDLVDLVAQVLLLFDILVLRLQQAVL